jgi:hypothetical protein
MYIGLIAALIWVGMCADSIPGRVALAEWIAVGLAVIAILLAITLALT